MKSPIKIKITKAANITPSLFTLEGVIEIAHRSRLFVFHLDSVNDKSTLFYRVPEQVAYIQIPNLPNFQFVNYKNRSLIKWLADNRSRMFA